jgi:hypothetical protein
MVSHLIQILSIKYREEGDQNDVTDIIPAKRSDFMRHSQFPLSEAKIENKLIRDMYREFHPDMSISISAE